MLLSQFLDNLARGTSDRFSRFDFGESPVQLSCPRFVVTFVLVFFERVAELTQQFLAVILREAK